MNKLFSNDNIEIIFKEILNIIKLNEKNKKVKDKVLEDLKKKMQLIFS